MKYEIISLTQSDRDMVADYLMDAWGFTAVVSRGVLHEAENLPGFAAIADKEMVGLVTYHIEQDACEIVTLNASYSGMGIGSALIEAVKEAEPVQQCQRLWLITTNDNIEALRFYQKRGFEMVAVHRGAIAQSRLLKPAIPLIGNYGIPIRDEIEFEMVLGQ